jgi:hypothetical protein
MDSPAEEETKIPPWPIPKDVEDMAYIGICRTCHHITFISIEGRIHLESLGDEIKQIVIEGNRYIRYLPCDEAKALFKEWWGGCDCYKKPEQTRIEF